jgi:hypothetical protein
LTDKQQMSPAQILELRVLGALVALRGNQGYDTNGLALKLEIDLKKLESILLGLRNRKPPAIFQGPGDRLWIITYGGQNYLSELVMMATDCLNQLQPAPTPELTDEQAKVWNFLRGIGAVPTEIIAERVGINDLVAVERLLQELTTTGLVERAGEDWWRDTTPWRVASELAELMESVLRILKLTDKPMAENTISGQLGRRFGEVWLALQQLQFQKDARCASQEGVRRWVSTWNRQ